MKSDFSIGRFFSASLCSGLCRNLLCCVFFAVLSACGFSPVYGDFAANKGATEEALGKISVLNIPDRKGQILRNHLIDRLYVNGRPQSAEAFLEVSLRDTETDLGIKKDQTASRREMNFWANYALKAPSGEILLNGVAHSVVSYNKLSAQYGTLASRENATNSAMKEIGEQIVNRISLYFSGEK